MNLPDSAIGASDVPQFDALIAGAGLAGLALAPGLAHAGLAVAVADRAPLLPTAAAGGDAGADDWDPRVYAISAGSAAYLRSIGAWQALPLERMAPVESMRVTGDAGGVLDFSAYDQGERALAWIVEERELRRALVALVHATGVRVFAPCAFASLAWNAAAGELQFDDGAKVRAKLIVGADGMRSWVRAAAGIRAEPLPYRQTAVVASFACALPHRGRAWQWFRGDGSVLAWLPLPGRRISIVWSAPEASAGELLALDAASLAARVAAAGDHVLGELRAISPAAGFPLAYLKLPATVAHRLVLVGDAAHGIHPLAGQGINLGFGDAAALAGVQRERGPVTDPGAPLLLERYARQRVEPVLAMQTLTHGLVRLFDQGAGWLEYPRNLGMAAVDRLPLVKRLLTQSALR